MSAAPQPPKPSSSRRNDTGLQGWYRMAGAGFEFIVAVMLFAGVGWWLDGRFDTLPWLTVAGTGLGFVLGMYILLKLAKGMFKQ